LKSFDNSLLFIECFEFDSENNPLTKKFAGKRPFYRKQASVEG